jgi:hypothetical protein
MINGKLKQQSNDDLDVRNADPRHAYLEWLRMEARLLQIELHPEMDADDEYSPRGTFAGKFHFPIDMAWNDVPKPSTRAESVMRSVGVEFPQ